MPPKKSKPERPEPMPDEVAAYKIARENREKRPVRPTVAVEGGAISSPNSDPVGWTCHMHEAMGTKSYDFAESAVRRIEMLVRQRGSTTIATAEQINAGLAILAAVQPANELEAAMGEQMVGAHLLSVDLMAMAARTETIPKMEAYVNMATKLSRTFTGQIEALAKLRSGGKQQVIVKHVYVNGNAIVADNANTVMQGGGDSGGASNQSHAPLALADGVGAAVLCQDPLGEPLPIPRSEGPETLQDARRDQPWRSEG